MVRSRSNPTNGEAPGASRLAGIVAAAIGGLVLFGWAGDVTIFKSVVPGVVTMKANTALSFALAGVGLSLVSGRLSRAAVVIGRLCAAVSLLIGLLTVCEYASGRNFGIDELLAVDVQPAFATSLPGRMGINTATSFVLVGLALLLLDVETARGRRPAQLLALGAATIAFIALLGYAYSVRSMRGFASYTEMAIHTALAFLVLAAGVLAARPKAGVMAVLTSRGAGGILARRLLPLVVAVPVVLGFLRLEGQRRGLYGTEEGVALLIAMSVIIVVIVTYWNAARLEVLDRERDRAQAVVAESEERFRQIAENFQDVVWMADADLKKLLYVNPACGAIWQPPCGDLYANTDAFLDTVHADDRDKVEKMIERRLKGEAGSIDYRILRPDKSVRWILDRWFTIRNAEERVYRIAGIAEDVTERRHLEQEVRQSQSMEAMGRLVGGIAHDFNNMLTAILGYANLLLEQWSEPGHVKDDLQEIRKAAERAATLTGQLLTFSRKQNVEPRVLNLNTVVADMTRMLQRLIDAPIELRAVLGQGLGSVRADRGQIEQVIMNLTINASDAMPDGGRLTIETANVELDDTDAREHESVSPGRYVMLSVSDSGCGMSDEVREHVFEPFFTTKPQGKGTGLGLATVYGIVKQSGGNIWLYSEVGRGTTFKIYLPRVD